MNKKIMVRQNSFKDCGPSCLLSIMKYYNVEASHEEVTLNLKMNKEGTNAYNIIDGARLYGFDGYGTHYSYEDIVNKKTIFPIICHVKKNNFYHFIVVYSANKKYLRVMDPSSNNTKLDFITFKKIYLNTSIVIYPVKKITLLNNNFDLISFFKNSIKKEKKIIIKIILFSITVIILTTLLNTFSLLLIDYILPNYSFELLFVITIIFIITGIFKNIVNYYKNILIIYINKKISIDINKDIINKFFNLPYLFFKNKSTPEVISRINDLETFREVFTSILVNLSSNLLLIIASMIILVFLNIKLFILNLISLIIYSFIIIFYKNKINIKTEESLENGSIYNKILNENIYGYETNRNINLIDNSINSINNKYEKYINSLSSYSKLINKRFFIKDILFTFIGFLLLLVGGIFISSEYITLGEFILFFSIINYFNEPIKELLDLIPKINYFKNIYNRINDLLLINENKNIEKEYLLTGNIRISNLSYSYNNIDYVLNDINLTIPYKSKYLIYGKSGNGKSTIIKILLKYLNDYKGKIQINNINLKNIPQNIIQYNFTYVCQNNYLSNDTIKNNIIVGRNISELEYKNIINICNLNNLIESKCLKDNFMIEDNGFNISGGEKQKIILARSLLKESNYIILDEALSEIDVFEEKEILTKIFDYFSDKTIVYISHKEEIMSMFKQKYKIERSSEC